MKDPIKLALQTAHPVELKKTYEIESARFLPFLPKSHPCSKTHGHSFNITLTLQGPIKIRLGWLVDYHEIDTLVKPVLKLIDHAVLNDVKGLSNPTTENLTVWLFQKLKKKCPELVQVTVKETSDTECSFPIRS